MPNVVTYCRVSSEEQAQKDLSIPAQRKILMRWMEDHPDHKLAGEFVDEGESAFSPAHKREGFTQMVGACKKGDVDFILVHKLDRFSRNREESILFKSLLRKHGVTVKSVTEKFDPETPQGFLYEGMIEVINQFYSMNLATEVRKGMRENAERGFCNGGGAPYGYRKEKVGDGPGKQHSKLVMGPEEEVAVVRDIFHLSLHENLGSRRIAERLNRRKVPSPTGGKWHISTINNMVTNQAYAGHTVWNKKTFSKGLKPEKDWVVVENTHEPIIDPETFRKRMDKARTRIVSHHDRTQNLNRPVKHLLSGLIRCGSCGGSFVGRRYSGWKPTSQAEEFRYLCSSYIGRGKTACAHTTIYRDWLEGRVIDVIRERICSSVNLTELERMVREKIEARRSVHGKDQKAVERRINALDRKIDNFYRAIGDGMDPSTCKGHIDRLEAEKSQMMEEARTLQQEDYYRRALENNVKMLRKFAGAFNEEFTQLPFATKRQAILHFIESITVVDHRLIRIVVRVPFDDQGIKLLVDETENPPESHTPPNHSEISKENREKQFVLSDTPPLAVGNVYKAGDGSA